MKNQWNKKAMTVGKILAEGCTRDGKILPFSASAIEAIYGTCTMRGFAIVDVHTTYPVGVECPAYCIKTVRNIWSVGDVHMGDVVDIEIPAENFFGVDPENFPDVVDLALADIDYGNGKETSGEGEDNDN